MAGTIRDQGRSSHGWTKSWRSAAWRAPNATASEAPRNRAAHGLASTRARCAARAAVKRRARRPPQVATPPGIRPSFGRSVPGSAARNGRTASSPRRKRSPPRAVRRARPRRARTAATRNAAAAKRARARGRSCWRFAGTRNPSRASIGRRSPSATTPRARARGANARRGGRPGGRSGPLRELAVRTSACATGTRSQPANASYVRSRRFRTSQEERAAARR